MGTVNIEPLRFPEPTLFMGNDVENNISYFLYDDYIINTKQDATSACFGIYDDVLFKNSKRILLLSLMKPIGYTFPSNLKYSNDMKDIWILTNDDVHKIYSYLKEDYISGTRGVYNNWRYIIDAWNSTHYVYTDKGYDRRYKSLCRPGSDMSMNIDYIPLDIPIPDYTTIVYKKV